MKKKPKEYQFIFKLSEQLKNKSIQEETASFLIKTNREMFFGQVKNQLSKMWSPSISGQMKVLILEKIKSRQGRAGRFHIDRFDDYADYLEIDQFKQYLNFISVDDHIYGFPLTGITDIVGANFLMNHGTRAVRGTPKRSTVHIDDS
ncbi:MAG: hypothetical protein EZS28_026750 [Streblomastix strix]|uniref:Uncharacterized protein n=1 Tax=Streblomastix strix TaxID=222440 RepID=A0A5J4V5S5_9EUKA|nr:MAG: hypothetical protein EZS28_026750 [Streblomastix strix]